MKGEYSNLFDIEVYDSEKMKKKVLIKRIAAVDEEKCYAAVINAMPDYFSYLKTNFSDPSLYNELDLNADSASLRMAFNEAVKKDAGLISKIDEHFLKTSGKLEKDKVVFEEIRDIATKFFAIKEIDEQDRYVGKVCVGINMIEKTLPKRRALIEAFVFAALMSDLKTENSILMENFKANMKELYNNNLGIDKEERLLRAQGMMMAMMKNDPQLTGILATYYAKNMDHLPFSIDSLN